MATTTLGVVSAMTPGVSSLSDSQTETICASSMMDPPLTWNHMLSTHRIQHQPLTSPSVHLALLLDVHGRSSLTHMVVTIIRSWYLCLLLLETQTGGVILATGCFQRLTGSNLLNCVWTRSDDILRDQDPLTSFVAHVIDAAKDSIPRATTIPKKCNPWFDEEWHEMLKTRRALDRKVHRRRGPRVETVMSFRRTQAQARRLFTQKKKRIMDTICVKTQLQHSYYARVEQIEENIW